MGAGALPTRPLADSGAVRAQNDHELHKQLAVGRQFVPPAAEEGRTLLFSLLFGDLPRELRLQERANRLPAHIEAHDAGRSVDVVDRVGGNQLSASGEET
jgi:hypothetical protein